MKFNKIFKKSWQNDNYGNFYHITISTKMFKYPANRWR